MSTPSDIKLYNQIKSEIYDKYPTHSAYRSGLLVKRYKQEYARLHPDSAPYIGSKKSKKGLSRWFQEHWTNQRGQVGYERPGDIYRPNIRVSNETPITYGELSSSQVASASKQKKRTGHARFKNV
jgi:hypothetical protein